MASNRTGRIRQTFTGYFLPPEDEATYDIDDNDLSDDDDFPELSDAEFSGARAKSQPLKYVVGNFVDYQTKKQLSLRVKGPVPMDDPWWSATIKVEKARVYYYLRGIPVYKVRTDNQVGPQGIVSLFMKACRVDDHSKLAFYDFLRSQKKEHDVTFENVDALLADFEAADKANRPYKDSLSAAIKCSTGPGLLVWGSLQEGDIFEILLQLFPRRFKDILTISKSKAELLPNLRKILDEEPWVLGFNRVLSRRDIGIKGMEATLKAFQDSGLIQKLTPVQKDALHIYDVLKTFCRQYGHTYLVDKLFRRSKHFQDFRISDFNRAYHFMEKEQIIKTEEKNGQLRIYLHRHWFAESSIAENIGRVFEAHNKDPWTFDIDYKHPLFETIVTDPDQKQAADLISQQAVVALSGRGGCGKTTVVSQVFKYAELLLAKEQLQRYTQNQFKADDIDDFTLSQTAERLESSENKTDPNETLDLLNYLSNETVDEGVDPTPGSSTQTPCQDQENNVNVPSTQQEDQWETDSEPDGTKNLVEPVILLTAPTGKAAHLLGARTNLPSFTLHQVTYSYNNWDRSTKWKFRHVRVLVVDECSLVPVSVFSWLLFALISESNLQKVVLLGDVCQLPSIEPGNFLMDTYRSLRPIGCSILLRTNHRAESQRIVENAGLIADKRNPVIDPAQHFHQVSLPEQGHVSDENDDLVLQTTEAINKLLLENIPDLGGHQKSQFVAFRRKDCQAINEVCCRHYSKHTTQDSKGRPDFRVGDKVCCTKNALVKNHLTENEKPESVRLCNGEIFFVEDDLEVQERGRRNRYLTLRMGKQLVKVDFRQLMRECKLKHAWARTIHTYQGSESDTVLYVVGSAGGQTWQHVYTAVTRGRKQVILITRETQLDSSIRKDPIVRQTSLGERLSQVVAQLVRDRQKNQPPTHADAHPALPHEDRSSNGAPGPHFVSAKSLLPPAVDKDPSSADNSQTFSDWGDGDMDAVLVLEQSVLGTTETASTSGHREQNKNKFAPADSDFDDALDLEEEIRAELQQSAAQQNGNSREEHLMSAEKETTHRKICLPESMQRPGLKSLYNTPKRAVKNLFGESTQKSTKDSARGDFDTGYFQTEVSFYDGVTNQGVSSTAVQTVSPGLDQGSQGAGSTTRGSVVNAPSSGSVPNSPNKRQLPLEGHFPMSKRQITEGPVTNSTVSPMRRTLGSISLLDETVEEEEEEVF